MKDELHYKLYDISKYNVWFSSDGYGASVQVVDESDSLEYQGTICGDAEDICDMKLKDGTYKWRLSSALLSKAHQEFIAYDFCDVRGYAGSELTFSMKGGQCSPLNLRSISDICAQSSGGGSYVDGMVTLEGVVELVGTKADTTGKHVTIVQSALLQEFRDSLPNSHIADEDVVVSAVTYYSHEEVAAPFAVRRISTVEEDIVSNSFSSMKISFVAQLPAKDLRISVADVSENGEVVQEDVARVDLEDDLKLCLGKSMSSGMFVARILSDAKRRRVESLLDVTEASVVTLSIKRLHRENEIVSILGSFIIVCGAFVMLVVSALIVNKLIRGARRRAAGFAVLSTADSVHNGSNSFPVNIDSYHIHDAVCPVKNNLQSNYL